VSRAGRFKLWCASVLLPVGVALIVGAVEEDRRPLVVLLAFLGYVLLLFVPALIADVVVEQVERRIEPPQLLLRIQSSPPTPEFRAAVEEAIRLQQPGPDGDGPPAAGTS
jgi:hypothetical protein